jgi:DNA mismatch repair protein MutL
MAAISVLPPDLVAKIAAGEVVERPTSVVKELVENALDAGATAIRVELQRGGLGLIRVTDNGSGIAPDDLRLAVERHATSKLGTLDDLFRVRTLGFRGEALASIAAVAHLEIVSRARGHISGRLLHVEGGRVVQETATGCPEGTTVTVRQLFFNVPARHAFQRSPAGEARQIVSLCNQLALTAPAVRLLVESEGHVALQAPGSGDLRQTLAATYGAAAAEHMLALPELEEDGVRVWGYCSGPEEHRNTRLYCTFAVNGRMVRSQMLAYAVEEAYHALLPVGRHPLGAIHLSVPPDEVDVNVHPAKTEIRLRRDRLAFSLVRNAVRRAVAEFAPIPALQPSAIGGGPYPETGEGGEVPPWGSAPDPAGRAPPDPREGSAGGATGQPELNGLQTRAPVPPQAPAERSVPGRLRALGQVGLTYIVAEDASGVYLIDQHSAHERVMYEQLLAQARDARGADSGAAGTATQLLLAPEALDLTPAQSAWLRENAALLHVFGFHVEPFGANGTSWLLRAVPRAIAAKGRTKALGELIDDLVEHEYGDGPLHDQARWAVACHSAVRAGDSLLPEEMAALIEQLERCDMRRTCPHGRPTMIHLSHAQLEREFGRR